MAKPLPKAILKPQATGEKTSQSNPLSRSHPGVAPASLVHLGDGVYWDLNKAANPHMVILGTSGSGKTQTLKAIVWEMYQGFSTRSIVLDFHGDQELPGEIYYPIHMASAHGINPLTINPDPEGGGSKLQAISVAATLRRALVMGTNQEGLLILMIQELYEQFGIIQEDRQTWTRRTPHLGDLQDAIDRRAQAACKDSQALQIKLAATFQYGVFSRAQIDLSAGRLIRVDLSKLPPELGAIAAEAILKQVMDSHRLAGESPELKTFVFVDEAKEIKNSKTLDRITADGRKYGLGIVLATQRETHISSDVLANTATKILLPVDVADIRKVANRFRFDAGRIANLGTFQALVRTGGTAVACTIKPFYQRQV
jgi:type IV secretory pathway VirB4 component